MYSRGRQSGRWGKRGTLKASTEKNVETASRVYVQCGKASPIYYDEECWRFIFGICGFLLPSCPTFDLELFGSWTNAANFGSLKPGAVSAEDLGFSCSYDWNGPIFHSNARPICELELGDAGWRKGLMKPKNRDEKATMIDGFAPPFPLGKERKWVDWKMPTFSPSNPRRAVRGKISTDSDGKFREDGEIMALSKRRGRERERIWWDPTLLDSIKFPPGSLPWVKTAESKIQGPTIRPHLRRNSWTSLKGRD